MQIQPVLCPSCFAVVEILPDADRATCEYCGTTSIIEYAGGQVSLKVNRELADLRQTVQESTFNTVRSIQESGQNTQRELQYLRLSNELSRAEARMSSVQSEINTLKRNTDKKAKKIVNKQLVQLQKESTELTLTRNRLNQSINALMPEPESALADASANKSQRGCLGWAGLWFLVFLGFSVLLGSLGDPIIFPTIFSFAIVGFLYNRRRKKALA